MAATSAEPIRLLDLSRLVSRAGRVLTGVDRVEFAYLEHLLQRGPLFGLVRSAYGYLLLDAAGCRVLRDGLISGTWGAADLLSRMKPGLTPMRARAESDLRRASLARSLPGGLGRMLRRHLPDGVHYLNTGHSNFTPRVIAALGDVSARIAVMVHDTIPLDFPQYQRLGSVETFRAFLSHVGAHADLILCNSHQTEAALALHLSRVPDTLVAPLGVDQPIAGTPPEGPWNAPYFVTLGTIEPRKNHALLLDIWPDIPDADLLICGARGWENHAVFDRLDAGPDRVHELPGLDDPAVFGLIAGAAGFVFPSLAEGYGLPPIEAAALGVPVLCNDLAIYRETLGDIPVYAEACDRYLWTSSIRQMAKDHIAGREQAHRFAPPRWETHFKGVLTLI